LIIEGASINISSEKAKRKKMSKTDHLACRKKKSHWTCFFARKEILKKKKAGNFDH
jgi:hypothetical protein